jgi:perosamine synthetase
MISRLGSGSFIHPQIGMNFRMTDLQCAVGVAQLKKFKEIERIKLKNYMLYQSLLENVDEVSFIEEVEYSNFVPFRVNIRVKVLDNLIPYLEESGIQTRRFFYPLHQQPCFRYLGYKEDNFPISNKAYFEGLSLPVFCTLKEEQISYVCKKIKLFYVKGGEAVW